MVRAAALRAEGLDWYEVSNRLDVSYSCVTKYTQDPRWPAVYGEALESAVARDLEEAHVEAARILRAQMHHESPDIVNGALKVHFSYRAHRERLLRDYRLKNLERLDRLAEAETEEAPAAVLDPRMPGVDLPADGGADDAPDEA